jgi:hypothetical protein
MSQHCFWLLLDDEELAIRFSEFPWFKSATIEQLSEIERPTENHLYWPKLDVDLSVESIRRPEDFPLISTEKNREKNRGQTTLSPPGLPPTY